MPNNQLKNTRAKEAVIKDLINEERIEEDLISLYDTLLGEGIAECFEPDLIDQFNKNLVTLKDESKMHRIVVASILKKYNS